MTQLRVEDFKLNCHIMTDFLQNFNDIFYLIMSLQEDLFRLKCVIKIFIHHPIMREIT